jgi:hypothetical protein
LRRALIAVLGVAVAVGVVLVVVFAFSSRDESDLSSAPAGPGQVQPDGASPPASGPHSDALVTRDRRPLSDDELVNALALGDVVILYDTSRPAPALVKLQRDVAGPFDAELAAAGQAVILAPRKGAGPATALAWKRILRADPGDPHLQDFAEFWLGRGIP